MRFVSCDIFRDRVPDGQGGWTVAGPASAQVFGTLSVDPLRSEFICGAEEDVRLEDVIEVGGRHYRVLGRVTTPGAPVQSWEVENVDRPRVSQA